MRLVGIGECMVELSDDGDGRYRQGFAGDVFNSCYYYAALAPAAGATFVSAVGDDSFSVALVERCNTLSIRLECARLAGATLGLYLIGADAAGERRFTYWRNAAPARRLIAALTPGQRAAIEGAQLLLVSGITLAILDTAQRETLYGLLKAVRRRGGRVVFDPNYRPALWESADAARYWIDGFYRVSDVALPGLDDERALFGATDPADVLARETIARIPEVVVKAGAAGVCGRLNDEGFRVAALPAARVVDTTGAGDAFNGAYLAARGQVVSAGAAAAFAARVAAVVIARPGAIVPIDQLPQREMEVE